jgi:NAD(P)-dependent dehydrogenase (short-subunit alcohol dehydrogenase family)
MELRGKNVLITGASSGIGYATARALAAEGAKLAMAGRNLRALDELADAIVADGGIRPVILPADLSSRGGAELLAAQALDALKTIDVVINDAAVEGVGSYAARATTTSRASSSRSTTGRRSSSIASSFPRCASEVQARS